MPKTFEKVLSAVTVLAAVAYSLGWLKVSSYFQTFGIGLSSLDLSVQDYLFESWYVVENVLFFVVFSWVLQAGFRLQLPQKRLRVAWRLLLGTLGLLYLIIPLATDQALGHLNWKPASWLVSHYFSLLKFTPFAVLILLGLLVGSFVHYLGWKWETLDELFEVRPRYHLLLCIVVLLGWSVSLAKHQGAIDGKNVLRSPAQHLARVTFHVSPSSPQLKPLETNQNLYGLYESPKKYFVWDTTGFAFGRGQKARILVIPREKVEWVDASKEVQIEPGALFF